MTETLEKMILIKRGLLEVVALIFINFIALIYDSYYLTAAIAVDSAILGFVAPKLYNGAKNGIKKEKMDSK